MQELYSLENAQKFDWSSISGNLNQERVLYLEKYLVGQKILDAGCGGGAYVEFLSKKGLEVTGVDKYEQFLQVAREKGRLGTYVQGDITNLPFPDKVFDCTYCYDVLEHIDDQMAIKELIRVTSKRLIATVPQEDEVMRKFNLTFFHYQDKTHLRNYTEISLKKLISNNGCTDITILPELFIPTKELVIQIILKPKNTNFVSFLCVKFYCKLLNHLLDVFSYKEIHTGLVAVVNL